MPDLNIDEIENKKKETEKPKNNPFQLTIDYLKEKYDFKYNLIKNEFEYRLLDSDDSEYEELNEDSVFVDMMIDMPAFKVSKSNLVAILKSGYVTVKYNPIEDYFNDITQKPYDPIKEPDYIKEIGDYITAVDGEQFVYHLKKWLVRSIKCAFVPDYYNKQCFTLKDRRQNNGKSTFCRWLCPGSLKDYLAENIGTDKDSLIKLSSNWIINLDELAQMTKRDLNSLKSLFSKENINERLPYDARPKRVPRIANFVGSTNEDEFLTDDTGTVRWLVFELKSISWDYVHIGIDNIWRQAFHLYNDENYNCELSKEDIEKNEERNKKFRLNSMERDMVQLYIHEPDKIENGKKSYKNMENVKFYNSTEVVKELQLKTGISKLTNINMGKALNSTFDRDKHKGVYGYWLKFRTDQEIEDYKKSSNIII
ncbi:VapE domain-containing protein [Saccharicrinis sp. FJH54]|uniref:VapE domain-containing protein n=1 Tax=Saccharicrinis sp. FJH54 TaxID=3344665 RepID=UPI0035D4A0E3